MDELLQTEWMGPQGIVQRIAGVKLPAFSICTLVTRWNDYNSMVASYEARGFNAKNCEFLVVDNGSYNRADAFVALNELLQSASAPYVILCHQDVTLLQDGKVELEARLHELEQLDPTWAVVGNAGMTAKGWPVASISDPNDRLNVYGGPFPVQVVSLDENWLLVKRAANLALSRDLQGFHHYGVELCFNAAILGWSSYVVDFFLRHHSGGNFDAVYEKSGKAVAAKYRILTRSRYIPLMNGSSLLIAGPLRVWSEPFVRRLRKLVGMYPRNRQLHEPNRFSATRRHRRAVEDFED